MRRSLIILTLAGLLLPALCTAQVPDPKPAEEYKMAEQRKKKEEEMRRAEAEAEALRKKAAAEEAAALERYRAQEEMRRKMAELRVKSKADGFQLLKVPVSGGYYLGMRQREYDSLLNLYPFSVTTETRRYELAAAPQFSKERLYMLTLSIPDSVFTSELPDITSSYKNKLGTPDEEKTSDSLVLFPEYGVASLDGEYRVKETALKWQFNYHDISIWSRFIDLKNGTWKGRYEIRYTGTVEFVKNLVKQAEKE